MNATRRRGEPPEPEWITEPALLAVHAQQIERYGGSHGILDGNVVLSALARPLQIFSYVPDADLPQLAAAYLVGFARAQGFSDGNKRTGLACALVCLELNGQSLDAPPEQLYAITMAVANGEAGDDEVADFIRRHVRPV